MNGRSDNSEPSREDDISAGNASEAETEVPEAKPLDTDDWDSLEPKFSINGANSEETSHTPRTPQHFVDAERGDETENTPEHSITLGSEASSEHHILQQTDVDTETQSATRASLAAFPAAATAGGEPRFKRKRSSQSD